MRELKVGETVHLRLFRTGHTQDVEFALPERPVLPLDILAQRSVAPLGAVTGGKRPAYGQ